ncbi:MAG: 2-amino-3,7-dideoxy-D-threo-hept-6-ulosonate synthase [Candidatus Bathyarchaeia archaeon]
MVLGKQRRLGSIFREDGKTVIIAMDHGVTLGPIRGLENMQAMIDKVSAGRGDAIVVHKGIASNVDAERVGLIVHLSASTSLGPDALWKVQVSQVKEAVRLGADGVSVHINVGADQEPHMLTQLGATAAECSEYGMPLLAMMYPRGPRVKSEHDPDAVAHASRMGAELGADVIKTPYTGSIESFRTVVESCPVPVVIAGGPKTETDRQFLELVANSMAAGASGVSIGRNVFQHINPTRMVKAVTSVVHRKVSVDEAVRVLEAEG